MKSITDRGVSYETGANTAWKTTPLLKDIVAKNESFIRIPDGIDKFICIRSQNVLKRVSFSRAGICTVS